MQLNLALIRKVFPDRGAIGDLRDALKQAQSQEAQLAVLPEIAPNVWSPASKRRQDDKAPPAGRRHRAMSEAARAAWDCSHWRRNHSRSKDGALS